MSARNGSKGSWARRWRPGLASDQAFRTRKMRFGGDDAPVGSKFSRWGLGAADIKFAYDLLMARKMAGGAGRRRN